MTSSPDEIRTDRLLLRRAGPGDLRAAITVLSDPRTHRYNPAGPPSPEEVAGMLAEWQAHWAHDGIGYWAVELPPTGEVVGFGGLRHHRLDGEPTLNLFYRFRPAHWGRGYATEMARAAVEWADRARPDRPVVIITDPDNEPSQRVARKLGFTHAGDSITIDGPVLVYRREEATLRA
ncbi:GNAT family N-acetyltransferase [Saccharothrix australiensis]|uniref:RimJ/RimL family protein N-acetyltransferase n=1 Tax=Saccharothrix australiensis TaxID=2072 RepID=A0A495WBQ2_9PSEU|nr:GNAT family N-acetyltransferase [Saccharothrix australiensis]RKT57248.1 RimJ/RimL family protein N-acetyltransferase [Saccharothrix australiensis]